MNNTKSICKCSEEGYSPDCPQAFVQNGQILHVLNGDDRLKPRKYIKMENDQVKNENQIINHYEEDLQFHAPTRTFTGSTDRSGPFQYLSDNSSESNDFGVDYERALAAVESSSIIKENIKSHNKQDKFQNDTALLRDKREILKKFEALKIGEQSLTDMSIGGFQIDLSKAAQKAKEIAPLPAARLPIIFRDGEMNFLHHFFQGFEILIGRDTLVELANTNVYRNQGDHLLYSLIEKMLKVGYERTDDEITIFSKKVLTSTFEMDPCNEHDNDEKRLIVAANLWGFQYIESGMQCREADLKMWLSINYNHFRTIWYNTFKSSGIPAFALEGVQSRYEGQKKAMRSTQDMSDDKKIELIRASTDALKSYQEKKSSRSHKSKDHRRTRQSDNVVDAIFGIRK